MDFPPSGRARGGGGSPRRPLDPPTTQVTGAGPPWPGRRAPRPDRNFRRKGKWIALPAGENQPTWRFVRKVYFVAAGAGGPKRLALPHDEQPNIVGWSADGVALRPRRRFHRLRLIEAASFLLRRGSVRLRAGSAPRITLRTPP